MPRDQFIVSVKFGALRDPAGGWSGNDGRLAEALGALDVTLTGEDIAAIGRAVPKGAAAGERYPALAMADLDSEK